VSNEPEEYICAFNLRN